VTAERNAPDRCEGEEKRHDAEALLVQCEHCPVSCNRWLLTPGVTVGESLASHIATHHPANAEPAWVEDDDYVVFTLEESIEEDIAMSEFQHL
jgi:hypothetical protein